MLFRACAPTFGSEKKVTPILLLKHLLRHIITHSVISECHILSVLDCKLLLASAICGLLSGAREQGLHGAKGAQGEQLTKA